MAVQGGATLALNVAFTAALYDTAPTFTNIAADALEYELDVGRNPYSGQYDVGVLRVRLLSFNGKYDPDNPTSPYYGNLTTDKQVQLLANSLSQFRGWTATWEPSQPVQTEDGSSIPTVLLTVYDILWLQDRQQISAGLKQAVLDWSVTVYAYWRLGEADSTSIAYDETGNQRHGRYVYGPRKAASGLAAGDPDGAADMTGQDIAIVGPAGASTTSPWAVSFLLNPSEFPSFPDELTVMQLADPANLARNVLVTVNYLGQITVGHKDNGTVVFSVATPLVLNQPNYVSIRRTTSQWIITVVNPVTLATGITTSAIVTPVSYSPGTLLVIGSSYGSSGVLAPTTPLKCVIDEVVIWTLTDPGDNYTLGYLALEPGQGDDGGSRARSIMDVAGVPTAWQSITSEKRPYASNFLNDSFSAAPGTSLAALRLTAESHTAEIYASRSGILTFYPYTYPLTVPTPAVVFDDQGAANPSLVAKDVIRGDTDRRTRSVVSDGEVTAAVENASAAGAQSDDSVTIARGKYSDRVSDVALRRSRALEDPGSRIAPLTCRLSGMTVAQRNAVLGLDLTSQIAVVSKGQKLTGKVIRRRHHITPDEYEVSLSTEPNPPFYTSSARATGVEEVDIATATVTTVSLSGEEWDDDAHHVGVGTGLNPSAAYPRLQVHPDAVHLFHAAVSWEGNTADTSGLRELAVGQESFNDEGRATYLSGANGTAQQVGALVLSTSSPGGYTSRIRQTSLGFVLSKLPTLVDPYAAYAPSFSVLRLYDWLQKFRASRTTAQSITSATNTALTPNDERFDVSALHNNATNPSRATLVRPGVWLLGNQLAYAANATGHRMAFLSANGASTGGALGTIGSHNTQNVGAAERTHIQAVALWKLDKAEYFEPYALQDSGGALNVDVVANTSPEFWGTELPGPSVRRTNNAALSITNNTATRLSFNTVRWDDMPTASTSTQINADRDGILIPLACVRWASNATGERWIWLLLNGTTKIAEVRQPACTTTNTHQTVWVPWKVKAGDYIETWVKQTSGGALNVESANYFTPDFAAAYADYDLVEPSDIPGLEAWYDADNLGLADNAAVRSWPDSSGHLRDLLQGTAANQPTLQTNELNGHSVVRFDGTNDYLTTAFGLTLAQPLRIFVVAKSATASGHRVVDGIDGTNRAAMYGVPSSTWRMWATGAEVIGPTRDANYHIHYVRFTGATSTIRVDGGAGTTGNPGAAGLAGLTIGAGQDLAAFHDGDIAEIIVYSSTLTFAQLNALGRYLSVKYALPWAWAT